VTTGDARLRRSQAPDDYAARLACLANARERRSAGCGHNVHHDQPRRLAEILEDFLGGEAWSRC
jgi:pimeloyl-ACP methyl ester carboxylesterase